MVKSFCFSSFSSNRAFCSRNCKTRGVGRFMKSNARLISVLLSVRSSVFSSRLGPAVC